MKTITSFIIFAVFLLGTTASRAESDKKYTDRRLEEVRTVNSEQNRMLSEMNLRVDKLEENLQTQAKTINQLIEQLENLQNKLGENAEKINKLDTKTEKVGKRWVIALWVGIPVVVLLLAGVVFLFLPTPFLSSTGQQDGSGRPKCPCCGWEHDPGDTVCKNPACKTQF